MPPRETGHGMDPSMVDGFTRASLKISQSSDDMARVSPAHRHMALILKSALPVLDATGYSNTGLFLVSVAVGPVMNEMVTQVKEDGNHTTYSKIPSFFMAIVSQPGNMKSRIINCATEALDMMMNLAELIKAKYGGTLPYNIWVEHLTIHNGKVYWRDVTFSAVIDTLGSEPKMTCGVIGTCDALEAMRRARSTPCSS
jgi:hypothetical protein